MNASAERWSATADAYAGGSSVVATDGARWTAAAEAYGALSAPAVLGITTPSELGGMFGSTSEPATGIGRRGVTPRVGSTPTETSSPNGTSSVGGDTDASYHPLP
jgi:hypothetical protein